MKRKTIDGLLIPETRIEFSFEFKHKDQKRFCYTLADDEAQASKLLFKTFDELGWNIHDLRRAA
jgi:hypothetical protein